jgi:oxalate decarboxylase
VWVQVVTAGGWIKVADVTNFPISTQFAGALVYFAPGSMRQFHWHTNFNEWQFVINGTLEAGVILEPGSFQKSYLQPGDAGYAPMSSAHYLKAVGDQPAYAVLMFDNSPFTNIDMPVLLSQVPKQVPPPIFMSCFVLARRLVNSLRTRTTMPAASSFECAQAGCPSFHNELLRQSVSRSASQLCCALVKCSAQSGKCGCVYVGCGDQPEHQPDIR